MIEKQYINIIRFLIDSDSHVCRTAKQFVKLLSFYDGPAIGIKAICFYFREAKSDKHLWHLVDLIRALEMKHPTILAESVQMLIVKWDSVGSPTKFKGASDSLRMWKNMLRLLKTDVVKNTPRLRKNLTHVLQGDVLICLLRFLDPRKLNFCMDEASLVVDIISRILTHPNKVPFDSLFTMAHFLVDFLFKTLSTSSENGTVEKLRNVSHVSKLLNKLSSHQAIQNDALRNLVQSCLNTDYRNLFLARISIPAKRCSNNNRDDVIMSSQEEEFVPQKFSMYVSLMRENLKKAAGIGSLREHSTSFHSGKLIKRDANRNWEGMISHKMEIIENADAKLNLQLFLGVLLNVCMINKGASPSHGSGERDKDEEISVEAMRKVALLLVEIVSPDVMFNGLPWPDEEFSKVSYAS